MADLSPALTAAIDRMAREWMPVSEVMPTSGFPVLVWNGECHLARWTARFTVEDYLEDESYMTECDEEGNWWMREGWYEQIGSDLKSASNGWDFVVAMVEKPPVTHWTMLPAPPAGQAVANG